jgi:Ribosomal protein S8
MHSFSLSNFLGGLLVAQQRQKITFKYKNYNKLILYNVRFLLNLGYINGYTLETDENNIRYIIIYLKYFQNKPLISTMKIYTSPSRFKYIKLKKLKKLVIQDFGSTYVLSTSIGIVDGFTCLQKSIGGLLLYKLNF